ncbi:MAG: hypothetical protein JKY17_08915 [Magnetovibrio sp.]|nr:hypothetical protein [Magnetovibrio sp.]
MTSGRPKKFLFDTEFGVEEPKLLKEDSSDLNQEEEENDPIVTEPEREEVIIPTFSASELDEAREEGKRAGRDEAIADMSSALEQQMATALKSIDEQVDRLFSTYTTDTQEHSRIAVTIASVIMRKLFPSLNAEHSMVEIENIINEAMQRTTGAPSLLIKVPSNIHKDIEDKVAEMAALRGRVGKITVMAEDNLADGDLQVEWDGGGILRDSALIWDQIDGIIERNLGSKIADITHTAPTIPPAASNQGLNHPIEPEQDIINQDVVGKNEENMAASPQEGDKISTPPSNDGVQPNKEEPVD